MLLAFGIWEWLPKLVKQTEFAHKKIAVQEKRLRVFRATIRTAHDIINNFLQNFQLEAMKMNSLKPESLELMDSIIQNTATKLKKLRNLNSTPEKQMTSGIDIDYEQNSS